MFLLQPRLNGMLFEIFLFYLMKFNFHEIICLLHGVFSSSRWLTGLIIPGTFTSMFSFSNNNKQRLKHFGINVIIREKTIFNKPTNMSQGRRKDLNVEEYSWNCARLGEAQNVTRTQNQYSRIWYTINQSWYHTASLFNLIGRKKVSSFN